MIKGVIFDLDDTLYLERDYIISGFIAVSRYIDDNTGIDQDEVFDYLWQAHSKGVRGNTFNGLLEDYQNLADRFEVQELVDVYRNHEPEITLLPDATRLLITLRKEGYYLGVISDGFLLGQQLKVKALKLETLVDTIVLTDRWGREFWKPHLRAFEKCAQDLALSHSELCYVADNPVKDFIAPNQLGWLTIKINLPGQNYSSSNLLFSYQQPKYTIRSHIEVLKLTI
jgi:putative hydrolase of the HAD superfamily